PGPTRLRTLFPRRSPGAPGPAFHVPFTPIARGFSRRAANMPPSAVGPWASYPVAGRPNGGERIMLKHKLTALGLAVAGLAGALAFDEYQANRSARASWLMTTIGTPFCAPDRDGPQYK